MNSSSKISRRQFLKATLGTVGGLALGGVSTVLAAGPTTAAAKPISPSIQHIVLLMMENRSFDHFVGWLPGADGKQAGLTYLDSSGVPHSTHPLAPDYQGCAHPDPDHSYTGGRVEFDNGACDGWLRAGSNDDYSIGYYTQRDLAFLGAQAPAWTSFDRYFAAIMAETYPNRIYQHAAQTDRLTNTMAISTLPTIWDLLASKGVTGRYYYSDVPFLALWGSRYISISRPFAQFISDCATGSLPQVSFVDPRFLDENSGTSGDDHPHADVRNGEAFMNTVYAAVVNSPLWQNTVLVINYDEWGGFFDHVAPSVAPVPSGGDAGSDGRRGFRVPCLLISPWARRAAVSHTLYDHTSVLRMIESRWGLGSLTTRDASANNLTQELDFRRPNSNAPQSFVPPGPYGTACPVGSPSVGDEWTVLQALAKSYGWP